ncbi:secreted protein [methanotrophic bacterial endosymbiont of Bathymodiolus sp.]|nr:secreted protein [methanotrophic bacterial endosymbiont of Bathymodiolus sp.]
MFSLLILTFLVFNIPVSYAKEDLTKTLNNAYSEHDRRKTNARGVAIFAKACFGHPSPSKQQKCDSPHWFIDNIRYKAQLLEEKLRSGDLRNSHRAAQVHWKYLLNVVSTRLPIDEANASKLYTYQEELDRAKNKLEWLYTFKSYVVGMESFNDIEYNQDELKATKEYVNKQKSL